MLTPNPVVRQAHHEGFGFDTLTLQRIVLVTTCDEADPDSLRRYGKQAGAAEIMVPDDIIKVKEIPMLGSGKTDYVSARRMAMESLGLGLAA